jgi:outer membrane immunogenic protein
MRYAKSLVLAATALATVALAQTASAADLPRGPVYKAPPAMVAIRPTWTGCYIGGNVGGAFGTASATDNVTGAEVSGDGSGFAGGGQVGCDYEFGGGFVIGLRNMFDWTSNSKSGTFPAGAFGGPAGSAVANFDNQWFDTLTGRVGYAVAPDWLLYFQGGGAWVHTSTNVTYGGIQYGQTSNTRSGWTIGGGVEWMFAPHWSAFIEGNYMDFGSEDVNVTGFRSVVYPVTFKATESNVLVGVNFRFF